MILFSTGRIHDLFSSLPKNAHLADERASANQMAIGDDNYQRLIKNKG
ncbi:hypothetical protein [Aliidiomarina indica]|nr:hypothetical protein [Aliidiomarina indica]